jgi:hypothetical protein
VEVLENVAAGGTGNGKEEEVVVVIPIDEHSVQEVYLSPGTVWVGAALPTERGWGARPGQGGDWGRVGREGARRVLGESRWRGGRPGRRWLWVTGKKGQARWEAQARGAPASIGAWGVCQCCRGIKAIKQGRLEWRVAWYACGRVGEPWGWACSTSSMEKGAWVGLDWLRGGRLLTAAGSRSYQASMGLSSASSMISFTLSGAVSPSTGSDPTGCPSARDAVVWRARVMTRLQRQK